MGAFDNMGPPGSGPEFDSIDPSSKFASFDSSNLESLAGDENAPSPDGAASQGALGNPSSEGETPAVDGPAALGEEGPQDMLSIFNQSDAEDRVLLADTQTEALATHGLSLEGGLMKALTGGGPQVVARAAQFGIDLMPFADKMNPDGSFKQAGQDAAKESGQAFGAVPTDGQPGPTKDQDTAAQAFTAEIGKSKEETQIKKQEQREAIAAFLLEMGLRTLASNRPDAGGAAAEGALGAMDARSARKRQAEQDDIAAQQRERTNRRQDEQDEAAKLEAQRAEQDRQYEISQRPAEEAKTARAGLQSITNEEGEVYYFDPLDAEGGEWVEDAEGNRIKSADVGLSKAQIATNRRAYEGKVNTKVEKIKGMDQWERNELYPSLKDLKGEALRNKIIELAQLEVSNQAGDDSAEPDPLGLLQ